MEQQTLQQELYARKFQATLSTIASVGAVIWAAETGRKGKFWWFIGAGMVGGSVGYLLDSFANRNTVTKNF